MVFITNMDAVAVSPTMAGTRSPMVMPLQEPLYISLPDIAAAKTGEAAAMDPVLTIGAS